MTLAAVFHSPPADEPVRRAVDAPAGALDPRRRHGPDTSTHGFPQRKCLKIKD